MRPRFKTKISAYGLAHCFAQILIGRVQYLGTKPHILTLHSQLAAIRATTIRQIHQDMGLLDEDAN